VTSLCLFISLPQEKCECTNGHEALKEDALLPHQQPPTVKTSAPPPPGDDPTWGQHRLAIIVPFRDRFDELLEFVPHMHQFLSAQRIRHKIVVVNQQDKHRFNRAALINIGFLETKTECDYIAMHDVDLMPMNPALSYAYPADGPMHLAAPDLHPKYHYPTFVGGILLLKREHFEVTNGLSNKYWGWGREDDEFYVRMRDKKLQIKRPKDIYTGYDTFKHVHDHNRRPRDNRRYGNQKADTRRRDHISGLDTIEYEILTRQDLLIESAPVTILNVQLTCDFLRTPWCV
ncbi:hypothetical protein CAPTEDRAFT_75285, partial [Capitella teleta]